MKEPVTKKIPIVHAGNSLIGTPSTRPVSWGNYHWLWVDNEEKRVVNMWLENLQDAVLKNFLDDGLVNARIYSNFLLIDDDRIPDNYYYHPLHLRYMKKDLEEVKDAYDYWGDPNNEYEEYTNPKAYYEKRGGDYNEKTGIITFKLGKS